MGVKDAGSLEGSRFGCLFYFPDVLQFSTDSSIDLAVQKIISCQMSRSFTSKGSRLNTCVSVIVIR